MSTTDHHLQSSAKNTTTWDTVNVLLCSSYLMKFACFIYVSWSCFETLHCGNKAWYSRKQSTGLGANCDPSVSPASWTGFRLDLHEKWVSGELEPWAIAVCQQLHKKAFSFSRSDTRPDHSHYGNYRKNPSKIYSLRQMTGWMNEITYALLANP